jgi:hypothetical protein
MKRSTQITLALCLFALSGYLIATTSVPQPKLTDATYKCWYYSGKYECRIDFGDAREWCGGTMDEVLACFRELQQVRLVNRSERVSFNSEDGIDAEVTK